MGRAAPITLKAYTSKIPDEITVEKGVTFRIRVNASGGLTRQWRYRYRYDGAPREMTLPASGEFREHLAQDYRRISEWKNMLLDGVDPKQSVKRAITRAQNGARTFRQVALENLENYQSRLSSLKQQKAIKSELERYAFPVIGDIPIADLRARDVADVLRPLWHEHYAVARKVRDRISVTCSYAVGMDYMQANPVSMKILETILGKTTYKTQHFKATPYHHAPALFKTLTQSDHPYDHVAAFVMTTLTRSLPLSLMTRSEVVGNVWECAKTKNGNPYNIPLSEAAMAILDKRGIADMEPEQLIFPGIRATHFNENAIANRIQKHRPGEKETAHGLRATVRTYLEEKHSFGEELLEVCMQHQVQTIVQRAYNRGDWLEKRRPIMEAVGEWLTNE